MDVIFLSEIKLDTMIGVDEWERLKPQTVQLDLEIGLPRNRASASDNVADTIDYAAVIARIRATLAEKSYHLAEALAEHIAQLILKEFGAPWTRVTVTKLGLMKSVKRVGVTIIRGQRTED
jgi:7,8-dihydroneopterin aldolase/epimerase/oxygenase